MRIRPSIVLFGDSIAQFSFGEESVQFGWGSLLAAAYQRRADVLNRGFSGYNTRHALDLVPRVFGSKDQCPNHFLFVTLFFGSNDASLPGERQHVPLKEYGENIRSLVHAIRSQSKSSSSSSSSSSTSSSSSLFPIIIMTPPPMDDDVWRGKYSPTDHHDRLNSVAREYGLEAKRIATELTCPCLDSWELLGGNEKSLYCKHLSDGLHLSESGNRLVYEGLMELIRDKYPALAPQAFVDGEYTGPGIPVEEKLWDELC